MLQDSIQRLSDSAGHSLRAGPLGGAGDVSGDGCGRQGRRHQACDVGRQSAGLPGLFVQGAVDAGARPRFSVAHDGRRCPSADGSAFSTAPITRKCWWCGPTRKFSPRRNFPPSLVTKDIWKERFEDIRNFEKYQARNGTLILKFFLHVSKEEQAKRLLERIDDPSKNWKFNLGDVAERKNFDDYIRYYEDLIRGDLAAACALVRGAGRPQMVHTAGRGLGNDRGAGKPRSALSESG